MSFAWKPSFSAAPLSPHRRRAINGTPSKSLDHRHHHSTSSKHSLDVKYPTTRRRARSNSNSRTSSRNTTPVDADERPPSRSSGTGRPRRGSTTPTSTPSGTERRKKGSPRALPSHGVSPLTQAQVREGAHKSSLSLDESSSILDMQENREIMNEDQQEVVQGGDKV